MILQKYKPTWIKDFETIKIEIENSLEGLDFKIEHIGSTSVPNLDAKPIIDIDIVYIQKSDFEKIKTQLLALGYYHNGNQGIEDRDVFKRNDGLTSTVLDKIPHHLYACPADSKALERHIFSRNYLRNNDWARIHYQQTKYELAEKANQDRKVYAQLKEQHLNVFIDSIIEMEKNNPRQL